MLGTLTDYIWQPGQVSRLTPLYFHRTGWGSWWNSFTKTLSHQMLNREYRSIAMPFQTGFGGKKKNLQIKYMYFYRSRIPIWFFLYNVYASLGGRLCFYSSNYYFKTKDEGSRGTKCFLMWHSNSDQ